MGRQVPRRGRVGHGPEHRCRRLQRVVREEAVIWSRLRRCIGPKDTRERGAAGFAVAERRSDGDLLGRVFARQGFGSKGRSWGSLSIRLLHGMYIYPYTSPSKILIPWYSDGLSCTGRAPWFVSRGPGTYTENASRLLNGVSIFEMTVGQEVIWAQFHPLLDASEIHVAVS